MNDQPMESRDKYRSVIIDTRDGSITDTGGSEEHATITPDGGHQFQKTEFRTTTLDGYILKQGDVAFRCTKCATGPWSTHVMNRCTACQHYACILCTVQTPAGNLCTPCAKALQHNNLIKSLLSIR